jgi:hypothetical protein
MGKNCSSSYIVSASVSWQSSQQRIVFFSFGRLSLDLALNRRGFLTEEKEVFSYER